MLRQDSDTAVLEQRYGEGEWRILAFIGPSRGDTTISAYTLHEGACVRIRYFEQDKEPL